MLYNKDRIIVFTIHECAVDFKLIDVLNAPG